MSKSKIKPIVKIHDLSTDEIIEREMNDTELAQYEADKLDRAERLLQLQAKEAARQAIAERLGLTVDELQVLLG